MLGNDVIDLVKARKDSNWRRQGFLTKVFTANEQEKILNATCPETTLWLFWSMKEAAYKIVNRKLQYRFFAPQQFQCISYGTVGEVKFENTTFFTQSEMNTAFIHTIATADVNEFSSVQTQLLPNTPNYLSEFNARLSYFNLAKDANGIPFIMVKRTGENYCASISHHGDHLAIIFTTTKYLT